MAAKGLWSTLRASDGEKGSPNQKFSGGGIPLVAQVVRTALWATLTHRDHRYANSQQSQERRNEGCRRGQQLPNEVAHLYSHGLTQDGPSARTEKPAGFPPLNPEFACWLMGFPAGWLK